MEYVGCKDGGDVSGVHLVAELVIILGVCCELREERKQRVQRVAVRRRQQLHDQAQSLPLEATIVDFCNRTFISVINRVRRTDLSVRNYLSTEIRSFKKEFLKRRNFCCLCIKVNEIDTNINMNQMSYSVVMG